LFREKFGGLLSASGFVSSFGIRSEKLYEPSSWRDTLIYGWVIRISLKMTALLKRDDIPWAFTYSSSKDRKGDDSAGSFTANPLRLADSV
jgi:hypothetical protein